MKGKGSLYFIYFLIFVIIVLIISLAYVIVDSLPKKEKDSSLEIEKIDVSQYPTVNDECIFNVTLAEYQALTSAGCMNGYTRYNIQDIKIGDRNLNVSIIYSDKNDAKKLDFLLMILE